MTPILEFENFRVAGILDGVSVHVNPGETVALIGASGSGKSVLALSAVGLGVAARRPTEGALRISGRDFSSATEKQWRKVRGKAVSLVFQEPMTALDPLMKVGKQLRLVVKQKERVCALLKSVGLPEHVENSFPHQLSGGQRQRVLIAMAIAHNPDVIIADEPTTALDATVQDSILKLLARVVQEHGSALLMITHDLSLIKDMCERTYVMDRGRVVEEGPTRDIITNPQHQTTRELIAAAAPVPDAPHTPTNADILWKGTDLTQTFGPVHALRGVNLTLRKGEKLGIVGESGSGKSTLLSLITGLAQPTSGAMMRKPGLRCQMVFQDPATSLNPRMRIGDSIAEAMAAPDRNEVIRLLESVGLTAEDASRFPHEFSGGQRQRISIARALAGKPHVLVADEAVSALDVVRRAQIVDILNEVTADTGAALVFVSHDLATIRQTCDNVVVLQNGSIVERGRVTDVWDSPQQPYTQQLLGSVRHI
ncbi:ABC transporter ATP-binding protein [Corynebacterium renale]|uniref:ATP-binding cassette domain-containing protein n=1 Tax=Corynebacterium renale TaxID=1724 RepID=UPI000DA39469|nr:ABC transporter ATP-binding protein [Corynebacterium renale]SQG65139.1 ABC transporter ATP-binding protein [Corynebacterium renale]STC98029.1 ABC transporter ATP-binding protein [Corynebacterium renale]